MELELGLSLPQVHHVLPMKNMDLINLNFLEPKKDKSLFSCSGGGGLGLAALDYYFVKKHHKEEKKKRSFDDAFNNKCINKTLSLMVWDGCQQPNDGDDGNGGKKTRSSDLVIDNDKKENGIVGWPPIKSWRKKLLRPGHHQIQANSGTRGNAASYKRLNKNGVRNSIYVKVKMEGVAIARKIDVMLFNSYHDLITTLINMFARYGENDEEDEPKCNYTLSCLDKGGCLLAGDVPWKIFTETVQSMEILKQRS